MLPIDPEDYETWVEKNRLDNGWTRKQAEISFATWMKSHQDQVRRRMPPPEDLYTSLKMIEDAFKNAECHQGKGLPRKVFTKPRQAAWDKLLANVLNGHLYDNPEFPRYVQVGTRGGLPVYKVLETTSWLEVRADNGSSLWPRLAFELASIEIKNYITVSDPVMIRRSAPSRAVAIVVMIIVVMIRSWPDHDQIMIAAVPRAWPQIMNRS